jgi:tetratricopeptide (TPR) repeat protein
MREILIGLALALVAPAASAQTAQQRDWCYSPTATDDQTIDGCTALIGSGRETTAGQAAAYNNRSGAYVNKGLLDQAIADDNQSLALNPNHSGTYDSRGDAYYHKGLYDQAIADFTRSIALKPTYAAAYNDSGNASAYIGRGAAYAAKNLYDQAIADYTQAIALKPGDDDLVIAYEDRGVAYEKKALRDPAIADYRAALKIKPSLQAARDGLTRLGATP